ncbi:siderophore-interacting protein [Photobacterium sp. MCCC 1A19761]|uniref:siderophore-interacting protein n=1 Tax=Photobacterium sp. MCCC 1A19761 TaxID=3115000 RepID=UPI00307F5C62
MSANDKPTASGPVLLTVKHIQDITPNYRRICCTSPALAHYPTCSQGAHIKLMLPQPGQQEPVMPEMTDKGPKWADPTQKPILRTFSIRDLRREQHEIDIDVAMHGDLGPASRFAQHAKPGDKVAISLPGGPHPMLKPATHYYMAGDLTAVPALSAMLEEMPADSQGYVAIQVGDAQDIQDLPHPAGVEVRWFVGGSDNHQTLIDSVIAQSPTSDNSYFWFAGEEQIVVGLRKHVRRHLDVDRKLVYAVPYWRYGKDEEAYHQQRHAVMDDES